MTLHPLPFTLQPVPVACTAVLVACSLYGLQAEPVLVPYSCTGTLQPVPDDVLVQLYMYV